MNPSSTARRSPYKGLIPYAEDDAPFFFGREKETRLISANLFASALTLLYGASGVGKSSVLRAGVANQLRQREDLLVVVFNSWQGDPVSDLKQAIADYADAADHESWTRAVRLLPEDRPASLTEFLTICATQLDRRLMIILDQFEEYFLYHPQDDEFGADFPKAVMQSDAPVSFLISIREDFYAKLDRFEGRIPTLYDNYLRIEHLDRNAARVAIKEPIAQYNRRYASDGHLFSIEPELVEAVLKQVETGQVILGESGRGVIETTKSAEDAEAQIETPFLQLVMTRLWDQELSADSQTLRLQTLNDLGGAANIVRTHLDAVITKLQPREQEIAANVFHYLVTPSGTKIAYSASDLAGSAELNEAEVVQVLEKLSHGDVRILRPVDPPADRPTAPRYEIFHDVLAPAILTWRTNYVQAQERADAERRAAVQKKRADEQARVANRFRRLAVALAVVIVLALGAVVMAVAQTIRAKENALKADNYARESERLRQEGQKDKFLAMSERESAEAARSEANLAQQEAEEERAKTAEQIKIAEERKTEADVAQASAATAQQKALAETARAESQATATRVAFANLLSVQAKVVVNMYPQRSLLLAREALNATTADDPRVPAAEEALREVLARTGGYPRGGHDGSVDDVAVSPNNRWMISTSGSSSRLWNLTASDSTGPLVLQDVGTPVAFSADNRWLVTGSGKPDDDTESKSGENDNTVRLYDLTATDPTNKPRILRDHSQSVSKIAISPNSHWLFTSSSKGSGRHSGHTILMWNLTSPDSKPIELPIEGAGNSALVTAISPDSHWLVISSWDPRANRGETSAAYLWDLTAENPAARRYQLEGHKSSISNVTFSPDGHSLITSSGEIDTHTGRIDPTIRVWDLTAPDPTTKVRVLPGHEGAISTMAISPDSRWLVTGSGGSWGGRRSDNSARVWDLAGTGTTPNYVLPDHESPIFAITISPNGQWVATFARGWTGSTIGDITMRLWDLREQKLNPIVLGEQTLPIHNVVVSADNHWLVTSADNTARVWDLTASDPSAKPRILRGHEDLITSVAFSPDGHSLVTGSADKTARLWGLNAKESIGNPIVLQSEHDNRFAISDDKHWLVTIGGTESFGRKDTTAQVWDLTSQDPASKPIVLRGHNNVIFALAFSPENRWLATASYDETARLWNLAEPGADPIVLRGHTSVVSTVTFSPDKRWLVTGSFDGTACLWRMTPNGTDVKPTFILRDTTGDTKNQAILNLHISPDSHWLVTIGSAETPTRLWDLTAPDPAANSLVLSGAQLVAISSDSHWLVATDRTQKTARLWNLKSREFRDLPGGGYPFAFSPDHHWLVTCNADARLWDLTAADPAATPLILPGSQAKSSEGVVVSPDNQWLVTGNRDNTAMVWNLKDLTVPPLILKGHTNGVDRLAISADSRWLATGSFYDKAVRLWDLTSKNLADTPIILPINGNTGYITFSNESTGSHWLLTANSEDQTILLWNLRLSELKEIACRTAGRNLTEDEWKTYFPGQDYRKTCNNQPAQH